MSSAPVAERPCAEEVSKREEVTNQCSTEETMSDSQTTVTFDLKTTGGETVLLFTHGDWREPVEFMHHCSTKWATVLLGLRSGLEGGAFTAFPDDTRVSSSWR